MQPAFKSSEREWISPVFAAIATAGVAEQTTFLDITNRQYLFSSGLWKFLYLSFLKNTSGSQLGHYIHIMQALALQLL